MPNSRRLLTAHSGVSTSQTIQPSSNDWDYTHAQNEWPFAGNALGDHSSGNGGYVDNTGGDSCFRSLITFDGDFEITFTGATFTNLMLVIYEISEDANDSAAGDGNATIRTGMTNYWAWLTGAGWTGHATGSFVYNNTNEGTAHTPSASDVIKLERVGGQFNYYTGSTLRRAFTTTSSNPVRFWIGASGGTQPDIDDMQIVDHAKVQRDGFLNEAHSDQSGFGNNQSNADRQGTEFIATRSGSCETLTFNLRTVTTSFNSKCQIWASDGTSPSSQVGGDSDTIALDSTGEKTYTWTTNKPTLEKGKKYWWVTIDTSGGSGWVNPQFISGIPWPNTKGTGRHDTTTSITQSDAHSRAFELKVDTSAGEPTPDHDTLLLIQSNTTDGSTTFTDSSQFGRTVTAGLNVQHDTAQAKFGSSSILFDGTDDYLQIPDSDDWAFDRDFTVECWFRLANTGKNQALVFKGKDGATSANQWRLWVQSTNVLRFSCTVVGDTAVTVYGSTTVSAGSWHHACIVRASGNFTLYLDGTADATNTNTSAIKNQSEPLYIGNEHDSGAWDMDGWIDEIRISRVARWDANFTPPTASYPTS